MDNTENVIDSRDVIERIEQLSVLSQPGPIEPGILSPEDELTDRYTLFHELSVLRKLAYAGETNCPDWTYGAVLVRDSHFEDYARELAEDIGAINSDVGWPNGFIDWERAAAALLVDYIDIDFDDVTYWARA